MISRPTAPHVSSDAAFTLIEVIVGLALLSLVMGMMAGSVKGSRNVLAFIDRNNAASAVVPAQSFLLSSFAQVVPAQLSVAAADRAPPLSGNSTHVRFTTFHSPQGQIEGLYDIELRLEAMGSRPGAYDLVAEHRLSRPPQEKEVAAPPSRRSTLASNVVAASFSYFGTIDAEPDNWRWLDTWSSADRLPRLVRIDVRLAPDQPQLWRRLVFPLQLAN